MLFFTACSKEKQYEYEFLVGREDMERVLKEQKLNWFVKEVGEFEEAQKNIITLTNDDNIDIAVGFKSDEGRKVLDIVWLLPRGITTEKYNEFYHNELPELLELVGIFYGNKREIDKGLDEFLDYYLNVESNYENGVFWTKRMNENHLEIKVHQYAFGENDDKNRVGTLLVIPHESYEISLRLSNENLKSIKDYDSSMVFNKCTISELLNYEHPDEKEPITKYFIATGYLDDIKEIKTIPDSLRNSNNRFVIPNKDKYLSAKLIDNTGSMDVFVEPTSLNTNELKMEREHNVIMFYYENNSVFIVINSALKD